MNKPVRFLLVLFLAFIFCFIARVRCGGSADTFSTGEYNRLKLKADSAKVYCVDKGFNTNYCFLVDFCIHSGKKRFFVWDFRGDSVVYASLCAHGYGKNSTASKPVFSNVEGSYCSSLGRYKVGIRSYSRSEERRVGKECQI